MKPQITETSHKPSSLINRQLYCSLFKEFNTTHGTEPCSTGNRTLLASDPGTIWV